MAILLKRDRNSNGYLCENTDEHSHLTGAGTLEGPLVHDGVHVGVVINKVPGTLPLAVHELEQQVRQKHHNDEKYKK